MQDQTSDMFKSIYTTLYVFLGINSVLKRKAKRKWLFFGVCSYSIACTYTLVYVPSKIVILTFLASISLIVVEQLVHYEQVFVVFMLNTYSEAFVEQNKPQAAVVST